VPKTDKPIGKFIKRDTCRFCQGTNLVNILDFGNVPLAGAFLHEDKFLQEKYYPLDLNFCQDCYLVQVSNVVLAEILFQENYFFFSSAIGTLVDHFAKCCQRIIAHMLMINHVILHFINQRTQIIKLKNKYSVIFE